MTQTTNMNQSTLSLVAAFGLIVITGCMTTQSVPPSRTSTTLQKVNVPEIVATSDTQLTQGESLKITVIPVTYTAKLVSHTRYELADIPRIVWDIPPDSVYVWETIQHALKVDPEYLRFQVRINNQLDRSFRGAGTVVQFNVDGKLTDVGQLNYQELLNVIVPPRSEKEVYIYGPSPATLSQNAAIGVMFYDVVTETDVAGNVTRRQNFQWVFQSKLKEVEQAVPGTTREKKWIPAEKYRQYMMQTQSQALQQQFQQLQGVPPGTLQWTPAR
jgi:hypothetical protein